LAAEKTRTKAGKKDYDKLFEERQKKFSSGKNIDASKIKGSAGTK